MANIIILDQFTANQIAAGEVVERPVSVVKELVENSLDAGASGVLVDLEEGGLEAITVSDDGCGMLEEDLLLAFRRHATSKIRCATDLGRITTLGFRGEALPSIAAVSRMTVTTRTRDVVTGARTVVEGSEISAVTPAGCPPGTTVTVKDLFYNTPARRKTMKSPATEGALCGDLISRLALARPDVRFELTVKGRRVFFSPGSGKLIDAVTSVYGIQQGREMIAVKGAGEGWSLGGFTGKPALSRSTRAHITIIINGRYVRCQAIAGAVEESYRTLLPQGRRPVAILSLSVAPELLDVNVHPSKLEVRLIEEEKMAELITRQLREALRVKSVIPSGSGKPRGIPPGPGHAQIALKLRQDTAGNEGRKLHFPTELPGKENEHPAESHYPPFSPAEKVAAETAGEKKGQYLHSSQSLPVLHIIGQLPPTYILAMSEDGLYIIDQHAAHERILYEEFLAGQGDRPSQCLLVPVTLELDHRETAILSERVLWFTDAGFVIEHFGGNTFLLRGVPACFPAGQEKEFFLDLLDYFRERGPGASRIEFFDRFASSLACRNAVKSGEKLSPSSMDELLRRLSQTRNPYTCPHGRPTIIQLSYVDLEARFKR